MVATIDRAGRLVVPKRLREEAPVQAGAEARVERRRWSARDRASDHADAPRERGGRLAAVADRPMPDVLRAARARNARPDSPVSAGGVAATPDSSVVIAAFSSWNEYHEAAIQALGDARDLAAHAGLDPIPSHPPAGAVPHGAAPGGTISPRGLSGRRMTLPEAERRELVTRFARLSLSGGAGYDAIVALTAAHHGHRLLSCDRRAATTNQRLKVDVTYL